MAHIGKWRVQQRYTTLGFKTLLTVPASQVWTLKGFSLGNPNGGTTVAALFLRDSLGFTTADIEHVNTFGERGSTVETCYHELRPGDQLALNFASGSFCDVAASGFVRSFP